MNTDAHIVVGYDGKPDSIAALTWAAEVASLRGESIVVSIIVDPRETPRGTAWPESYWTEIEDRARETLAAQPDVPFAIERHGGHLVPRLVDSAKDSSMLVVGSKGHGLVAEIFRGSVSQGAARHASVPVVVVRPPFTADSGRIVVGADGSEASDRALDFACRMAALTGDKVVALRAWTRAPVVPDRFGYNPPGPDTIDHAETELGRTVDALRAAHPDVPIEGELLHGAPERGLTDASNSASMVVVGSQCHTAVGEVMVGSVSKTVLKKAHCPVAVVH